MNKTGLILLGGGLFLAARAARARTGTTYTPPANTPQSRYPDLLQEEFSNVPQFPGNVERWKSFFAPLCDTLDIPLGVAMAVIWNESSGDEKALNGLNRVLVGLPSEPFNAVKRGIVNGESMGYTRDPAFITDFWSKCSCGLMQVRRIAARDVGRDLKLHGEPGSDIPGTTDYNSYYNPFDALTNRSVGLLYLKKCYAQYGNSNSWFDAAAIYNLGPTQWRIQKNNLPRGVYDYAARVVSRARLGTASPL